MARPVRTASLAASLILASVLLAGCASTRTDSQWSDPRFAGRKLAGETVLVACEAEVLAMRRNCQDKIARQLSTLGARPVFAHDVPPLARGEHLAPERYVAAARAAGASALLATQLVPDATMVNPGPTIGFGIGGFGIGGSSNNVGGGVGVSMPVGKGTVDTGYAADTTLIDVSSGSLMWAARIAAPASSQVDAQLDALAQGISEAVKGAGHF